MKIEVTQDDIRHGEPGKAFKCPVALAASRAFGCEVGVGSSLTVYDKKPDAIEKIRDYKLPRIAEIFVANFDSDHVVNPFTFEIDEDKPCDPF